MLAEFPDAPLRAQIVWEPVLKTDIAPPLTRVLARIADRRAIQYWDPERTVSGDLVRSVNESPERYGREEKLPADFVAWDLVAMFGTSQRWEGHLPVPRHYGGPVAYDMEELKAAIAGELARGGAPR
ncbi:MAG TPA: hypothetical protein VFB67_12410 [Candidatus Polarisedimenticolaceae bacterium]|nr:hypothetical protein [Candidatus Polarisedimenticolaceae bacterium]